jgi:hypothetical protein
MPVGTHDRPNASRLFLSAHNSRTKYQSVMLVGTQVRPNTSRLYLPAHDSRTKCQFFYGEPHNVFLHLIFPVTVGRTCMVYGDKAVYLRFVAINGVLG